MSSQYIQYPPSSGGSSGVSSINALIGAVTIAAGSGITITPSGNTLTIAATGGGSGTVTSVALSLPAIFNVSGSPVTTSGTLTGTLANQNANLIFSGPSSGGAAAPTFRSLVSADIPSLSGLYANTALSNLSSTAVNADILPAANVFSSLGSLVKGWLAVFTTEVSAPTAQTLSIHSADGISGGSSGVALYSGGVSTAGDSGPLSVNTGNNDGSGDVGNLDIFGGAAAVGNGGNINIYTQVSGGTRGNITLKDGSESATGQIMTSKDANGAISWADPTGIVWDSVGKTLALGGVEGPPGTVPYAQTSQRTVTDPSGVDGTIFGIHYSNNTVNNGSLNTSGYFEGRIQVDAGISVAANAGVIFQAYRNNGASDAGSVAFLVGAFGGSHQTTTDPAATTDILAGVLAQTDIQSGTANKVADFYGLSGANGGTITTGQFGIYIEPPGSGIKDNWLSGKALIGGSSYASHGEILKVVGDLSATTNVTDTGTSAAIVSATSNTTTNGSNTTLGINGVAQGIVQAGAENDKVVGGMNFAVTRGDNTDDGTLDAMTGANTLLFHNSGGAGITTNVFGMSTVFFSQHGTATNLYDFYSERVPAGDGVVTNHYGLYIKSDSSTPVQNWISGSTLMGFSSFTSPTAVLHLPGVTTTAGTASLKINSGTLMTTPENGAIESTGTDLWWTDDTGTRQALNGAGGGGANISLSNLTSTSINQSLVSNNPNNLNLGSSSSAWQFLYLDLLKAPDDSNSYDVAARTIIDASSNASVDGGSRILFAADGSQSQDWDARILLDSSETDSIQYGNRLLIDPSAINSANWDSRFLFDAAGLNSWDWANRIGYDNGGNSSIDYQNRQILDTASVSILDWSTPGALKFPATITTGGTTGAQTINKISGTVNFAALATSLVVTNSTVTTTSIVLAIVRTNDATLKSVQCVSASGSFTMFANAAATAETSVGFFVLNS